MKAAEIIGFSQIYWAVQQIPNGAAADISADICPADFSAAQSCRLKSQFGASSLGAGVSLDHQKRPLQQHTKYIKG